MRIIGLTGPSGSGKSAVAKLLSAYGFEHIDADAVYHNLLIPPSECLDELVCEFGERILNAGGMLDRKKLAAIVFADGNQDRLLKLISITHKYVKARIHLIIRHLETNGSKACVIDAPLLFEAGVDKDCEFVIAVLADSDVRASRISQRDCISLEAARARISSQKPDEFYSSNADHTVYNNSDIKCVDRTVRDILKKRGVSI